jgi:hypothetical protein
MSACRQSVGVGTCLEVYVIIKDAALSRKLDCGPCGLPPLVEVLPGNPPHYKVRIPIEMSKMLHDSLTDTRDLLAEQPLQRLHGSIPDEVFRLHRAAVFLLSTRKTYV